MPALLASAALVAVGHAALGVDHTLPFVAIARARAWSLPRTLCVTALCGAGHVLASVALGLLAVGIGVAVTGVEGVEKARAAWAPWLLIVFGVVFGASGFMRATRDRPHVHSHVHGDGLAHDHVHGHEGAHLHPHEGRDFSTVAWSLFVLFLFGPCEPLIPLLMVPAMEQGWLDMALVVGVFGATTLATMLAIVAAAHWGLRGFALPSLERWRDSLAGATVALCGVLVLTLGI